MVELARDVLLRQHGLALPAHQTAEACWMLTLVVADCKPAGIALFTPSKWTNNWLYFGVRWQESSVYCWECGLPADPMKFAFAAEVVKLVALEALQPFLA